MRATSIPNLGREWVSATGEFLTGKMLPDKGQNLGEKGLRSSTDATHGAAPPSIRDGLILRGTQARMTHRAVEYLRSGRPCGPQSQCSCSRRWLSAKLKSNSWTCTSRTSPTIQHTLGKRVTQNSSRQCRGGRRHRDSNQSLLAGAKQCSRGSGSGRTGLLETEGYGGCEC